MKVTNETKIGALTSISIVLLILGFNFLKGRNLFKSGNFIYAKYADTKGLMVSNPVIINGLQIGNVYELEEEDKNIDSIVVSIKLNKELNIPTNSIASISTNPLATSSIYITLGNSKTFLAHDDTIRTSADAGLLGELSSQIGPIANRVTHSLESLDSLLVKMNAVFDPSTKNNMQQVIANANKTMEYLVASSGSLNSLLNNQTGQLAKSLSNVSSFTKTLADNNGKVENMMANLETASNRLSNSDIDGTIKQLRVTVEQLQATIAKVDSRQGSLGLLLNDKQLYNNLENTTKSLNILMDDIRVNPKRYVSISIFGGKNKAQPLTSPLTGIDTTGTK